MPPAKDSRSRVLLAGLNLLSRTGLNGLTIASLAQSSSLSKSGLFAHFRSKQDMQIRLLDQTAALARQQVVDPTLVEPEGLPRLRSLLTHWLGWTRRAGLQGGCPVAAGVFELDDLDGPVRDHLLRLEQTWRHLLRHHVVRAQQLGHLQAACDPDQIVWELTGIYLSHHASARFLRDPAAERRALTAIDHLFRRCANSTPTAEMLP